MNKVPNICFATMCKNEEHCIEETLESACKICDYWVVCDTGSTDNTCNIIIDFFKKKNIPGELFRDDWVNFGHNKTLLFERCYKKSEYILHFDADDLLIGDFSFDEDEKGKLAYEINYRRGGAIYTNLSIFNNNYRWKICGVAHNYAKCLDNTNNLEIGSFVHKDFYILSRDNGSRKKDSQKFEKDAIILKKQFWDTLVIDEDGLNNRSVFYTAQSYFDCNNYNESMLWYSLYTKLKDTWSEEIYISYIRISECMKQLSYDKSDIIKVLRKAINENEHRAEAYFNLGLYYLEIKDYYRSYLHFRISKNKNIDFSIKNCYLFINQYNFGNYNNIYLIKCCIELKRYHEANGLIQELYRDTEIQMDNKEEVLESYTKKVIIK